VRGSIRTTAAALACTWMLVGCGDATDVDSPGITDIAGSPGATAPLGDPNAARNHSMISISGTVVSATPHAFTLDYGNGTVTVEMDDWDALPEGGTIKAGDAVVVSGMVDQDLWERRKIEARSVFVRSLNAYFYANPADEETEPVATVQIARPAAFSDAIGYVTAVEGRELTIGSGATAVRVDTARLADNPLDDSGGRKIAIGDRVYAYGVLDIDPQERVELMADGVVSLVSTANADKRRSAPRGATPSSTTQSPA
jgi:uncharacterized protein YdeI (BOF family)